MDIDIDFKTDFSPKSILNWTRASLIRNGELGPHQCGYYPQNIPVDALTGLAAIPFDHAEEFGFTKIDFLHLSVLNHFQSREEIEQLVEIEPNWNLLLIPSEQKKLFQLSKHGEILNDIKPKSIEELADVLALIRPGKKNLVKLYRVKKDSIRKMLYAKDDEGYSFKKSHAIAYAMVIVLQLHLISAGLL